MPELLNSINRRFRQLTSSLRALPNFIILGSPKSRTTSLYDYLSAHPQILPARFKEVLFFDRQFGRGINHYRSYFPFKHQLSSRKEKRKITGEASPYYFQHPLVPKRIASVLPNIKLIVILREPTARAWSHYRHNIRHNRETLSFGQALKNEQARFELDVDRMHSDDNFFPSNFLQHSYRQGGEYGSHLQRWSEFFDIKNQLLILESEHFFRDPTYVLNEVADFLSIEKFKQQTYEPKNVGIKIENDQQAAFDQLRIHFQPEIARLSSMTGRKFSWQTDNASETS